LNNLTKNLLLWLVIAIVLMSVFNNFGNRQPAARPMEYSTFIQKVRSDEIERVTIQGREITGKLKGGESFTTYNPGDQQVYNDLIDHKVQFEGKPQEEQSLLLTIFINWFPLLLLVGVWVFFMRQMQGGMGGRGAMSFGKSKARMLSEEQNKITFDDVAGVEEAKEEVGELVEFLRDPSKFQKLGGRIPKGVLMTGSPGTGKTLIAEAMAREAGVNFFKLLDLKSMYVGESERRTTRAHNALREYAPGVVFVDEIDQKQRQRGGFDGDSGVSSGLFGKMLEIMSDTSLRGRVLWIFASNRPDLLDPAFKRDGRCDMRVPVLHPDAKQLERICEVARVQYPEIRSEVKSWSPHVEKCKGYNGATMIEVVRRAFVHAKRSGRDVIRDDDMVWACADYRPRLLDQKMIAQMNLLSILECSSNSLLPDNWKQVENESCEVLGIKNSGDATTDSSGLPVKLTGLN